MADFGQSKTMQNFKPQNAPVVALRGRPSVLGGGQQMGNIPVTTSPQGQAPSSAPPVPAKPSMAQARVSSDFSKGGPAQGGSLPRGAREVVLLSNSSAPSMVQQAVAGQPMQSRAPQALQGPIQDPGSEVHVYEIEGVSLDGRKFVAGPFEAEFPVGVTFAGARRIG